MDVLVSGGKKRKAPAASSSKAPAKKAKKVAAPLETDDADEDAADWGFGSGSGSGEVDDDELEAFEHARALEPSSDGAMDDEGWASVKTRGARGKGAAANDTGTTEVLELE